MRVFAVVPALGLVLAAVSTSAQTPPPSPRPAQTAAPRPQTQTPATPRQPDPPPASAVAPAPAPAPKFRDGAKWGFVNVQVIAAQSAEGRAAAQKIQTFRDQRQKELGDKQTALKTAQQQLESGGGLLNETARAQKQADIDRMQRELQRLAEDADQDMERLQQQLQQEFMTKLQPAIQKVGDEKQLDFIFSNESGLVHAAPDLNLTADVIRALDTVASAAPAAAVRPAPATTPPTAPPASAPPR